jgi:uncharacterized protein YjbI with pentapeptide repeats
MNRVVVALTVAVLAVTPAVAQNRVQIAKVRGGANCPGCNLFQANLNNLTLKGKNLSGARLRQADLSSVVMNGTSFARADLRDVDAYAGVFTNVNFAGANMTNANFVGTYLQGANFAGAVLNGVNFSGAEMGRARGLTQRQLAAACGDETTELPRGLRLRGC